MKITQDKKDPFKKFNSLYSVAENGCWEWVGYKLKNGYGHQRFGGKKQLAHRYSYSLHFGDFDKSFCVCHKCDNRSCVNPDHLFLGTIADNIKDCVLKNRNARGEKTNQSKLKPHDILTIRNLYSAEKIEHKEIAHIFGVSRAAITLILNNKRWAHI